jgi:hypothetical protein
LKSSNFGFFNYNHLINLVNFYFATFSTNSSHQGLQFLSNWDTITVIMFKRICLIIMLLDLNHFGITQNLHWKLQSLQTLYMYIVNANWQIFLWPIILVIAKGIPNVRVCFDITSFHISWFKWCNKKEAKLLVFNKEAHKLTSNFNM